MRLAAFVVIASAAAALPAVAADLGQGRLFYEQGVWERALQELQPLVDSGDAEAQFLVATIYGEGGKGVPQKREESLALYRRSADQGYAPAQFELFVHVSPSSRAAAEEKVAWARRLAQQGRTLTGHAREQAAFCAEYLGIQFHRGQLVPADPVGAHAWFTVAAAWGREDALRARELVDEEITAEQRAQGDAQAREIMAR